MRPCALMGVAIDSISFSSYPQRRCRAELHRSVLRRVAKSTALASIFVVVTTSRPRGGTDRIATISRTTLRSSFVAILQFTRKTAKTIGQHLLEG